MTLTDSFSPISSFHVFHPSHLLFISSSCSFSSLSTHSTSSQSYTSSFSPHFLQGPHYFFALSFSHIYTWQSHDSWVNFFWVNSTFFSVSHTNTADVNLMTFDNMQHEFKFGFIFLVNVKGKVLEMIILSIFTHPRRSQPKAIFKEFGSLNLFSP